MEDIVRDEPFFVSLIPSLAMQVFKGFKIAVHLIIAIVEKFHNEEELYGLRGINSR